jgi:2-keto-4-pentenoate hydratase/2-oxohepta-3-ene-1,7-dioic acid hydratase in catechol pathway
MAWHLVRFAGKEAIHWGRLASSPPSTPEESVEVEVLEADDHSLRTLIGRVEQYRLAGNTGRIERVSASQLLCPLTDDVSLLCQGLNYTDHAAEAQHSERRANLIFSKASSSLTGAFAPIIRPADVQLLDYEVEIGLVMRRSIRQRVEVTEQNIGDYIAGVVLCNDVSARDVMFGASFLQWFQGKSYRTFCPAGPSIYVLDRGEVNAALQSLELKLWLNGELRQSAQTNQLIYRPPETLSFISTFTNVQAGDLLLTGTPGGVTAPATPKLVEILKTHLFADAVRRDELRKEMSAYRPFMKEGDVLRLSLTDIRSGTLLGSHQNRISTAA